MLWLLLYLCFRLNVMGLLFVYVKTSVILHVYAFLGQRWKAVSLLETFSVDRFYLCSSCWTFNSHSSWHFIFQTVTPRLHRNVQLISPGLHHSLTLLRLSVILLFEADFPPLLVFFLLSIFLIRHIPGRSVCKSFTFRFVFFSHN